MLGEDVDTSGVCSCKFNLHVCIYLCVNSSENVPKISVQEENLRHGENFENIY